ncbi:GGDEF domain-containing protein [Devosia sp. I507]|nr:GGDEF domain-containing protein [Devosia sp. I507]
MHRNGAQMSGAKLRLSRRSKLRIYRVTGLLTAISIVVSIATTNFIMETFSAGINIPGLMTAIVMPMLLGTPAIGIIMFKHEQLRAANEQLQRLAATDWLTGCLNRGAFTKRVSHALTEPSASGALLILDIDHFKAINDNHGHDRGDDALRLIARTFTSVCGPQTLVGRVGGEEFGIFLPGASAAEASNWAETIRNAIAQLTFRATGSHCPLSVSVGVATFQGRTDFRALYRRADAGLYRAKSAGRDRIEIATAA